MEQGLAQDITEAASYVMFCFCRQEFNCRGVYGECFKGISRSSSTILSNGCKIVIAFCKIIGCQQHAFRNNSQSDAGISACATNISRLTRWEIEIIRASCASMPF